MSQTIDAKARIWEVSEREFAQKGFEGARVDEIARLADVNKAMIYYYFKSKENLLRSIIDRFISEVVELHYKLTENGIHTDILYRRQAYRTILLFFRQRKEVSRIILRELASGKEDSGEIILMLKPIIDMMGEFLRELGFDVSAKANEVTVHSTFFALFPVLMFVVLEDKMGKFLGTDQESAVECFERIHSFMFETFIEAFPTI